jgi:DNA repair exonuclease SbcCD ATPase subunit
LQAHIEAFNIFIREFKYYEPILDGIKQEYELMIENLRKELSQYEIVKSKLSVMEFRMGQEIDKVKAEFRELLQDMHLQNDDLRRQIEVKSYECDQLQNRYDALVVEQKRVIEQKPVETPELHELRILALEYADYEKKTKDLLDVKEQQVLELLAIKKKIQSELVEVTALYGNLKQRLSGMSFDSVQELQKKLEKTNTTVKALETALTESKNREEELDKQLKTFKTQLQRSKELKQPDWEYIQSQFSLSVREYYMQCKGLDYNDSIVTLIQELIRIKSAKSDSVQDDSADSGGSLHPQTSSYGASAPYVDQYFAGKGIGASIPKYLRTKSKILNRRLTKSQTLLLIRDVWDAKLMYEAKNPKMALGEFLFMYLKKRFGNQDLICEWGYNMTDALQKHRDSSVDCRLFHDVLNDKMDESIHQNLRTVISNLRDEFYKMDVEVHFGHAKGYLDKNETSTVLAKFFRTKPKKLLNTLQETIALDQPGIHILYKFMFESEGDSTFLETVKQQEMEDRQEYIKEIEEALKKLSRDETLSVFEATRMLKEKEPNKTNDEIDEYLSRAFACEVSELKPKVLISKKEFLNVS